MEKIGNIRYIQFANNTAVFCNNADKERVSNLKFIIYSLCFGNCLFGLKNPPNHRLCHGLIKEEMAVRLLIEKEMTINYWFIRQPTKWKIIKLATTPTIYDTLHREITNNWAR